VKKIKIELNFKWQSILSLQGHQTAKLKNLGKVFQVMKTITGNIISQNESWSKLGKMLLKNI